MSDSNSNSTNGLIQDIITEYPSDLVFNYTILSAVVLILYDYFLTLPAEVSHIWSGKINFMKALFILNRYFGQAQCFQIFLVFLKPATDIECRAFYYLSEISEIVVKIAINSIFIMRSYAIYGRSVAVFILLAIPGLLDVASGIWITIIQTTVALPPQLQVGPNTCNFSISSSPFASLLTNNISSAAFNVLVVFLTVYRTGRLALESRDINVNGSLSFILLRDGILYYSAIFLPRLVVVAVDAAILNGGSDGLSNVLDILTALVNTLDFVLVNRLVLNLSHAANVHEVSESRTKTGTETLMFAASSFLGNVGGSLCTLLDTDFEDEPIGDESGMHKADDLKAHDNAISVSSKCTDLEIGSSNDRLGMEEQAIAGEL